MKKSRIFMIVSIALVGLLLFSGLSFAKVRLSLKSANTASTYYAFAVGMAKAIMAGAPDVDVIVEESLGSVANVKASKTRKNYIFTSTVSNILKAFNKQGKFKEGGYEKIRALWPIPGIVMHWVVREDSGVKTFEDLKGKPFIPGGLGSSGEAITLDLFKTLDILDKVKIVRVALKEATDAVKNKKVVGFATSSPPPSPAITELAATVKIRLLSLCDDDWKKFKEKYPVFTRFIIPSGIYPGVDYDVKTFSNPVGTYTTADLPENVAYEITKAFWENRKIMEEMHPFGKMLNINDIVKLGAPLHPGAIKYYKEIGIKIPENLIPKK